MGKHFRKLAGLCLFALLLGACGAEASNPGGTTDNPPVVNPPTVDPEQTYTITWKNYDGSVLEVDQNVKKNSVPTYDGNPPTRPGSAQFSYVFSGWSPMVVAAMADATYTAQFTSSTNGYTVTWKDSDGTVLETDADVPYGSTPSYEGATPTKSGDAQYSYSFTGWSPEVKAVTGDVTYTAQYSSSTNGYTVTWKNSDGTVLETDTDVPYGSTPSYDGETPTKSGSVEFSYTFSGWSPEVVSVIGDATYTAQYSSSTNGYMVTWKNYDGSVLETDEEVPYGSMPSFDGETPTRADDDTYRYTFSGWDPEVVEVTGNATYKATYSYEKIKPQYTIGFDLNGGTSASYSGSKTVEEFSTNLLFFDCVKEGWNFRGWSYQGTKIFDEKGNQLSTFSMAKEMTFVALYAQTARMMIVTNMEGAGSISGEGEYPYNTYVDVSVEPNQGYDFVGWFYGNTILSSTPDYKYMMWSEDVTLEARFKLASFVMNVHSNNEDYGLVLLKSKTNFNYLPQYEEHRDYTTSVTVAAYSKTDVRFLGWYDENNSLVETNAVYSFVMPNRDYSLEAKWNYFTVNYVLNGGTNNPLNPSEYTSESGSITLEEPSRPGYEFLGWTLDNNPVSAIDSSWIRNIALVANWKTSDYSITYILYGGENDSSNPSSYTVEDDPIALLSPTRNGYTFEGWYRTSAFEQQITFIDPTEKSNVILYAKWSVVFYSITYELNGGSNSPSNPSSYTVEDEVSFSPPERAGYTFLGWYDGETKYTGIAKGTTGAVALSAHWNDGDAYQVTLDPNGGNVSASAVHVQYGCAYSLPTPSKTGYDFAGWYDGTTQIDQNGIWYYAGEKSLLAHWNPIHYAITYTLNGGSNSPSNPSSYTVENEVDFSDPTRKGHTFLGWYRGSGQVTGIVRGTTGPIALSAHWNDGDAYQVTLDPNGGDVSTSSVDVQYGHAYSLPEPTKTGYNFAGWYDGTIRISNTGTWNYTAGKLLLAHWNPIHYAITYTLNGGSNSPSNPSSYTVEDEVSFSPPERAGYTFLGWYDGETKYTGIAKGSMGALALAARWSAEVNALSVTSEDESKGTVSVTSGSGYTDETITVVATPADGCAFEGWYSGETKLSDQATFTFTMPGSDYNLVAYFWTEAEKEEEAWNVAHGVTPTLSSDGKSITYGLYPQTRVTDSALISSLDALGDSAKGDSGWYLQDGDYYAKLSAKPYQSGYKFDDGETIVSGTTYWFKCEPIKWDVLSESDGDYYVVSDVLLDAHCYYNYGSASTRTIGGETVYPNNYEHSDIRAWLNGDFYDSAFALGDSAIQATEVDNSAATTNKSSNAYACANTADKVFLPSYKDYLKSSYGFSTSSGLTPTRYCKTTDWARARGADCSTDASYLYNGYYWTRSPYSGYSYDAWYVEDDGNLTTYNSVVNSANHSVRPGLSIHIA